MGKLVDGVGKTDIDERIKLVKQIEVNRAVVAKTEPQTRYIKKNVL